MRQMLPIQSHRSVIAAGWRNSGDLQRCRLTPRWSGRVIDKVPSPYGGARGAQLNR